MRATFELKIVAKTLEEAKKLASEKVSAFMQVPESDLEKYINLELKVSYQDAKTYEDVENNMSQGKFAITVYGSIKQSIAVPFGV